LVVPQSTQNPADITPEIEIAWARAVSHAFDDPRYYRHLKADPEKALRDLGADVSGIDVKNAIASGGGLKPTLDTLDGVIEELERTRGRLTSALRPPYQGAGGGPCQSMQSGASYGTSCPTSIHLHIDALSIMSGCTQPTPAQPTWMQTQRYSGCTGVSSGTPCIALSQVATTRASATRGVAPPQWIGGPPSGGVCSA
jgi:hypothetical protein